MKGTGEHINRWYSKHADAFLQHRCIVECPYKLGDIIKVSANVRRCEQEGAPTHVITEFEQLLQVRQF